MAHVFTALGQGHEEVERMLHARPAGARHQLCFPASWADLLLSQVGRGDVLR